jgi:U3 small nucleolar RNA-associated protein 7
MRDHNEPVKLDYLPYHFLLVSGSRLGTVRWLDVSIGQTVAEARTKKGEMSCLTQNRMNGVISLGHTNGEVTMWTPNMGSTPVVKLLAHPSAPVSGLAISRNGYYMATTGKDSRLKIWDIRSTFKCLYDYFTPAPGTCVDWSDSGLVSCAFGNEV